MFYTVAKFEGVLVNHRKIMNDFVQIRLLAKPEHVRRGL